MPRRRALLLVSLLAAAVIAAGVMWRSQKSGPARLPAATTGQTASSPPPPSPAPATGAAGLGTTDPTTAGASGPPRRRLDAASRDRLAAALDAARATRTAAAAPAGAAPALPDQAPTRLDLANKTGHALTEWEQRQLDALNELLGECYDLARAESPALAGTVSLQFTVAAEPEIGGLVSEIRFDEAGTSIAHAGMRECMTESLHALELEPPPAGVEVSRQVTLDLAPGP